MSRWLMTLVCSLAIAAPAFAQDDLDALLAGLGDESAVADVVGVIHPFRVELVAPELAVAIEGDFEQ